MTKLTVLIAFAMLLTNCARSTPSDELNRIVDEYLKANSEYSEKLENVKDSKDLAAAIDALASATERFKSEAVAFDAAHPELQNLKDLPPELKAVSNKLASHQSDLQAVVTATENARLRFDSSPAVIKAYERLRKAGQALKEAR